MNASRKFTQFLPLMRIDAPKKPLPPRDRAAVLRRAGDRHFASNYSVLVRRHPKPKKLLAELAGDEHDKRESILTIEAAYERRLSAVLCVSDEALPTRKEPKVRIHGFRPGDLPFLRAAEVPALKLWWEPGMAAGDYVRSAMNLSANIDRMRDGPAEEFAALVLSHPAMHEALRRGVGGFLDSESLPSPSLRVELSTIVAARIVKRLLTKKLPPLNAELASFGAKLASGVRARARCAWESGSDPGRRSGAGEVGYAGPEQAKAAERDKEAGRGRRAKRPDAVPILKGSEPADKRLTGVELAVSREQALAVAASANLKPRQLDLVAHCIEGSSLANAARRLGIKWSSAAGLLERARPALRAAALRCPAFG